MRNGIWLSGIVLLLFAFSALQFHALRESQSVLSEQNKKITEQINAFAGSKALPHGARAKAVEPQAVGPTLESISQDLQGFMRESRSRQTGFERKISDVDDRMSHEREAVLGDLKSFLDDMRTERQDFTKAMEKVRGASSASVPVESDRINDLLAKMDEEIGQLKALIEKENKRAEQRYQQETESVKIQGTVSGPGADSRTQY